MLLVFNYLFYAIWNAYYLILLFSISLFTYYLALNISSKSKSKNANFIISLFILFIVLTFFKTYNKFIPLITGNEIFSYYNFTLSSIVLPVGISFYIFQAAGYLIDVYTNKTLPVKNFIPFFTYLSFFPQLFAGPISCSTQQLPQFNIIHEFDQKRAISGMQLILWGLFKKVVVADRLSTFVNPVFSDPTAYYGITFIVTIIFYAFQLYYDFSAYSDMAIGTAEIFGIKLVKNFNRPFASSSIAEFWRCWHISLSSWVQNYIFTPLSIYFRNLGLLGIIFSVLIAEFIIGIWHGTNWTFAVFGLIHGVAISLEILTKKWRKKLEKKVGKPYKNCISILGVIYTFSVFCFSLFYFRAKSVSEANYIISQISTDFIKSIINYKSTILLEEGRFMPFFLTLFFIALVELIYFLQRFSGDIRSNIYKLTTPKRWLIYYTIFLFILFFGKFGKQQFIYFQF